MTSKEFNENDYDKKDYYYPTSKAYIYITIYTVILVIPLLLIYCFMWNGQEVRASYVEMLTTLIILFITGIIHELLHGLGAVIFCSATAKDIRFGMIWKALTPYAHCSLPMSSKQYIGVLSLPAVILGIVPYVLSLLMHSAALYFIGSIMLIGGLGDFFIILRVIKLPENVLIKDHPSLIGFVAYIKR